MNIAIDFDNTFSSDPDLFKSFIKICESRNHKCYIVTMRNGTDEDRKEIESTTGGMLPVIYCGHTFKRKVTSQMGINIHIWIDDLPAGIDDQRLMLCYDENKAPTTVWDWLDRRIEK